ncbi:MAG: glycosyltransferase family 2 protein [Eubacterium sp.]|nr:glycosyltransferase family 2 protein [Eubacterium sp.]
MKRVSVAMAVYNGEAYLEEQLDSILRQLGGRDEIVISDDGSTDRTLRIVRSYARSDARIRLVYGQGKGTKQNIANAIAHADGAYIFLADQDDVWMPNKVERVLAVFREKKCHVVVHDCIVTDAERKQVIYPSFFAYRGSGAGVWRNLWKNKYIGCCMALRRELVPYILPIPDDIQMHDQWIGILNDRHKGGCVFLKEPLLYYRRHQGTVSDFGRNTVPVMIKNRLLLLRRLAGR